MFGSKRGRENDGRQSVSSSFSNRDDRREQMRSSGPRFPGGEELKSRISQAIQSWYAPDGVVIDGNWQILYFLGQTGFYLEPAAGEASYNLLQIARESLKPTLRKAVEAALERNIPVEKRDLRLEHRGEVREIKLQILPLSPEPAQDQYFLVVFERVTPLANSVYSNIAARAIDPESPEQRVTRLERELAEARDYMRHAAQEEEAAIEELRAANEEIGSANEELQSVNEELGLAKEELQSTNEQLTTVNKQLHTRNEDLTVLSNDLTNLLNAIHLPVLMVDRNLRLRRFTPTAGHVFHLTIENSAQSLADLHVGLPWQDLDRVVRDVIDNLATQTQEIQDEKNCWWSLTIHPYRTVDQRIDGAVLTFADIDLLKRNLGAAQEARDQAGAIIDTVPEPLVVLTPDLHVQRANAAFYRIFGMSPEEAVGKSLIELGSGQWNISSLRQALEGVLPRNAEFNALEIEQRFPLIGLKCLRLSGRPIVLVGSGPAILLAIQDFTDENRAKQALLRSNGDLQRFASVVSHDLQEPLRTVGSYSQLLARRYADQLDAEAHTFLSFIGEGVWRMHALIRDLLEYAQVSEKHASDRHPVIASDALRHALASLRAAIQDSGAEVTNGDLPAFRYSPLQLTQLFQNLVGNAIKYRRPGETPRIFVSAQRQHDEWVFAVRDNGVGFPPEQAEQVFGVFQRLHGREYPGTGIGLAICQRIAEHHGGRIWAESQPGVGSTFLFTVPISE